MASGRAFGFANPPWRHGRLQPGQLRGRGDSASKRGTDSRIQRSGGFCSQHRTFELQLAADEFSKRMSQGCSSIWPTRTRARRIRARPIPEHRRRRQAGHAQHRVRRARETSAIWMPTTPFRTSIVRIDSAEARSRAPLIGLLVAFRFSGFVQMQSGIRTRFLGGARALPPPNTRTFSWLGRSLSAGFGRPSLCGRWTSCDRLGSDPTESSFNPSVLCSPTTAAGGYPGNQGFGNLGRNVLRGFWQRRVDLSLAPASSLCAARGTSSCAGTCSTS